MKTVKEVKLDGRTFTLITCCDSGNQTSFSGRSTSKKAQAAIERKCTSCNPHHAKEGLTGGECLVWEGFSLPYRLMPCLRTSECWR